MLVRRELFNQLLALAVEGIEYQNERWITVKPHGDHSKGVHLKVEDGESNKQAIYRKFGGKGEKKEELTKSQIEKKIEDIYADNKKIIGNVDNITQFLKDNPKIKEKIDNNRKQIDDLIRLKDKAKNDIKTEPVLNLSLKLIEKGTSLMPKTKSITTKIKNPDKARLKDYKALLKKQALKENPNFRFHSFDYPDFRDERV